MKKQLTIKEKQEVLIQVLKEGEAENPKGYAIFGIEKEVVQPLIKSGVLHKETYRYTGGAKLTKKGRVKRKPMARGTGIFVHEQTFADLVVGDTFFDADWGLMKWNGKNWIQKT